MVLPGDGTGKFWEFYLICIIFLGGDTLYYWVIIWLLYLLGEIYFFSIIYDYYYGETDGFLTVLTDVIFLLGL